MTPQLPDKFLLRRLAAYETMTPQLQVLAKRLDSGDVVLNKGTLLSRHEMGVMLNQVAAEEGTYGSSAMKQLARYFCYSESYLYSLRSFAEQFTRQEIEKTSHRRMNAGPHISFQHFIWLSTIHDPVVRQTYLDLVFEKSWSTRQLEREIQAAGLCSQKPTVNPMDSRAARTLRAEATGRSTIRPSTSPLLGAAEIQERFERINARMAVWTESVFDRVDEIEPDKMTPKLLDKLREASEETTRLMSFTLRIKERLTATLASYEMILTQRKHASMQMADEDFPVAATDEAGVSDPSEASESWQPPIDGTFEEFPEAADPVETDYPATDVDPESE